MATLGKRKEGGPSLESEEPPKNMATDPLKLHKKRKLDQEVHNGYHSTENNSYLLASERIKAIYGLDASKKLEDLFQCLLMDSNEILSMLRSHKLTDLIAILQFLPYLHKIRRTFVHVQSPHPHASALHIVKYYLNHRNSDVRKAAIESLETFNDIFGIRALDATIYASLIPCLSDSTSKVRKASIRLVRYATKCYSY
jgi:hypothetical protein